ncbi:MAG TPA: hypothetical protein VFC84_15475 [Desulfosporosinus sp.]|nr:hypothetical protein [Desulfosporosinus sp.]
MDGTDTGATGRGSPTLHVCLRPTGSGSVRLSQGATPVPTVRPTGARPRSRSDYIFGVAVDQLPHRRGCATC